MLQKLIPLLFASGDNISMKELASLLSVSEQEVESSLPEIEEYLVQGGLALVRDGGYLQIVTGKDASSFVTALLKKDLEGELTPAALQVLTIIAYLGEVTRSDVSFIRGVQSSLSIRTLSIRGLISRSGEVCKLTPEALRFLGITKNEELPEYEMLHKELMDKLQQAKEE